MDITNQQIADLFVTAYEGGSNYWIDHIDPRPNYSHPDNYGPNMVPYAVYADDDDTAHFVNWNTIQAGLKTMQETYISHWADLIDDNMDADTADVFLQCVCFGKIIYG